MTTAKSISEEEWEETYKPITNQFEPETERFETYGADYEFVVQTHRTHPGRVWTMLDCDGSLCIASGWHYVNRLAYYITEVPWTESIEVPIEEDDDDGE